MDARDSMPVGVIVERRKLDNPWQAYTWYAVAVVPGAPEVDKWRVLAETPGRLRYHAGTLPLELHGKETVGYLLNLGAELPRVYVVLRYDDEVENGIFPFLATVCPYEAQNCLDGDEDLVESVPMPDVVNAWLADFVTKHHVDEPFKKRKRKPYDPRKVQAGRADRP